MTKKFVDKKVSKHKHHNVNKMMTQRQKAKKRELHLLSTRHQSNLKMLKNKRQQAKEKYCPVTHGLWWNTTTERFIGGYGV